MRKNWSILEQVGFHKPLGGIVRKGGFAPVNVRVSASLLTQRPFACCEATLETVLMASLCRHAMRGQSAMALVRSGISKTKYGIKTGTSHRVPIVPGATVAAVPRRGLHSSSPMQQAATPGQAGSMEAGSAGGESGWTGGDGGDGHTGARTLGIAVFSTLVSENKTLPHARRKVRAITIALCVCFVIKLCRVRLLPFPVVCIHRAYEGRTAGGCGSCSSIGIGIRYMCLMAFLVWLLFVLTHLLPRYMANVSCTGATTAVPKRLYWHCWLLVDRMARYVQRCLKPVWLTLDRYLVPGTRYEQ